jgi:hypothetical protein
VNQILAQALGPACLRSKVVSDMRRYDKMMDEKMGEKQRLKECTLDRLKGIRLRVQRRQRCCARGTVDLASAIPGSWEEGQCPDGSHPVVER